MIGERIVALVESAARGAAEADPPLELWSQLFLAGFAMLPLILLGVLILIDTFRETRDETR